MVTASGDKTVRLYDCRAAKSIKTIDTPGNNYLTYNDSIYDYFNKLIFISWLKERILTFVGLPMENV